MHMFILWYFIKLYTYVCYTECMLYFSITPFQVWPSNHIIFCHIRWISNLDFYFPALILLPWKSVLVHQLLTSHPFFSNLTLFSIYGLMLLFHRRSFCILPSMPNDSLREWCVCVCDHFPLPLWLSLFSSLFIKIRFVGFSSSLFLPWTWWNPFRLIYRSHRDSCLLLSNSQILRWDLYLRNEWVSIPVATL